MLYTVGHFGPRESRPELVLNVFYIACLVMMGLYLFKKITPMQFNYRCSLCVGATVLLRDVLFAPPLSLYPLKLTCLTPSIFPLLMRTCFYARERQTYSKRSLWLICIIDMVIAALYTRDIYLEPINEYTENLLTEIWIRPAITEGLVICFTLAAESREQLS